MRRKVLSQDKLSEIIKLKEEGTYWKDIQETTGVDKRIAKREYKRWQNSLPESELKEIRKQVINDAFREHVDALLGLAKTLVLGLKLPDPANRYGKADEFIVSIWERYVRGEMVENGLLKDERDRLKSFHLKQKELLFRSLLEHEKDENFKAHLGTWKTGWDSCTQDLFPKLNKKNQEVAESFLNNQTTLLNKIQKATPQGNGKLLATDWTAKIMLEAIWQSIVEERPPIISKAYAASFAPQELADKSFKEEIVKVIKQAVNTMCEGHNGPLIEELRIEVGKLKAAIGRLEESLNPIVLRPVILRSNCSWCPA
ncbi:hypothetical protein ACFLTV_00800 [Chloroflexota bacterium]